MTSAANNRPTHQKVVALVAARTGSALSVQQKDRLERAIAARRGDRSDEAYAAYLASAGGLELRELMAEISVHKTDLFRDPVQLSALQDEVLPELVRRGRPLQVWSAGCATGEEVATLAVMLADARAPYGTSVLGTDLSERALERAKKLTFDAEAMTRVRHDLKERYFVRSGNAFALSPALRTGISFAQHNLMDTPYPTPRHGEVFDLVVCRNVLIYFTEAAFESTVERLMARVAPDGYLLLGAAEPILARKANINTVRLANAFLYVHDAHPRARTAEATLPPAAVPVPSTVPSDPLVDLGPALRDAHEEIALRKVPRKATPSDSAVLTQATADGVARFQAVLDEAVELSDDDGVEQELRQALYLAPNLAPARYLLGMLLEQRGQKADAASEYRRAIAVLTSGEALDVPFFLNPERLKRACSLALERTGFAIDSIALGASLR